MLHPVGELAPSVYWRRRALLLAALLLAAVSVYAVFFRSGGAAPPKRDGAFTAAGHTSSPPASSRPAGSRPASSRPASSAAPATSAPLTSASSAAAPTACTAAQLKVAAATDQSSYPSGAKPVVAIVVTDTGPTACVQDLSDAQIELRIYNGSARVWGSHDCEIQPGTARVTLPVGQATRREIEWSGLSSQPGCTGTRTRVGAGTYTLQAWLSGRPGTTTATFTLAG
jgi:hypothetical protein